MRSELVASSRMDADERGGARQPHRVVLFVGIIIVGENMHMQVGRLEDAEMRLAGLREG